MSKGVGELWKGSEQGTDTSILSLKEISSRTGEMAQWIRGFLCKHEDLT